MERLINLLKKIREKGVAWLFLRFLAGIRSSRVTEYICVTLERKKTKSDELYAVYDLNVQSPGFNLVQFLLCAEHYCTKNGYQNFSLVIVPKEVHPALEWKALSDSYGSDAISYRSINLFSALAALSPHCNGFLSFGTRKAARKLTSSANLFPEGYGFSTVGCHEHKLMAILLGEGMFRELKVPEPTALLMNNSHLLNFENTQLVTITLRNSKFDLARNSNIPEWIRFAEYLQSLGYKPIIIPDADQPFDKNGLLPKFTDIGLAATYNMGIRLGLYQKAFVNFFVPNGPVVFPINSTSIHYIYMKSWLEDTVMTPTSVSGYSWVDPVALRPYWGNELQMWNGDKDTFDNIKKHFDEFCSRIKGRIESTSSFNR